MFRILNGLNGEVMCELAFNTDATVASIKNGIQAKLGVPVEHQQLLFQNRRLQDDFDLQDLAARAGELMDAGCFDISLLREKPIETFEELDLKDDLLRGIYSYGFDKPSAIQQLVIRPMVEGCDILAQSQSGSGKTACYVVAGLQRIEPTKASTQTLVLAPTRELSCPIQKVALALGDHMRLRTCCCDYGGLTDTPHFVVGTPDKVNHMIAQRQLVLDDLNTFVLDEADEMMSRGYKGLILETLDSLPPHVQLAVFSATMPAELLEHMKLKMRSPVKVALKKDELTLEGIRQFYVAIETEEWKIDTLCDLFEMIGPPLVIVYCNTRRKVNFVSDQMTARNVVHAVMHAELAQHERDRIMQEFHSGSCNMLISTDLLVRGTDVQQVSLVINYDLPPNIENYLHRIGRSGRFGRKGVAINFVTNNDFRAMKDIERYCHTQIEEMPMDIADMI